MKTHILLILVAIIGVLACGCSDSAPIDTSKSGPKPVADGILPESAKKAMGANGANAHFDSNLKTP